MYICVYIYIYTHLQDGEIAPGRALVLRVVAEVALRGEPDAGIYIYIYICICISLSLYLSLSLYIYILC